MIADLVILGVAIKVVVGAVRRGRATQDALTAGLHHRVNYQVTGAPPGT